MTHFTITPDLRPEQNLTRDEVAFIETFCGLPIGSGFSFPVKGELKAPLEPWRRLAKGVKAAGSRYRWWINSSGDGCVARVK